MVMNLFTYKNVTNVFIILKTINGHESVFFLHGRDS